MARYYVAALFVVEAETPEKAKEAVECWKEDPHAIEKLLDVLVGEKVTGEDIPTESEGLRGC